MPKKLTLSGAFFLLSGLVLYSQQNGNFSDSFTLSQAIDTFEVYLDRADLEKERENWMSKAEFGMTVVAARWESRALLLMRAGITVEISASGLADELEGQMRERLASWLARRFFESVERPDPSVLFSAIKDADLELLYETDGDGEVRRDSSGNPLMKDGDGFDEDKVRWEGIVKGKAEELIALWEDKASVPPPELLALLSEDGRDESDSAFRVSFAVYKEGLNRELSALFMTGESRFVSKRLRDTFSLRKKSEGKTAAAITSSLIAEMAQDLELSLDNLRTGLESPSEQDPAAAMTIDPDKWRESFRREFDKGLERFKRAEEALLAERVSWEQEVGYSFKETEEAWREGYARLIEERGLWEKQISLILSEGERQWERKQDELAAAISVARRELEQSVAERDGSMQNRIGNLVDMFVQAGSTLTAAQTSGEYWAAKTGYAGTRFGTDECGNLYFTAVENITSGTFLSDKDNLEREIGKLERDIAELEVKISAETRPSTKERLIDQRDALGITLDEKRSVLAQAYDSGLGLDIAGLGVGLLDGDRTKDLSRTDWQDAFDAFRADPAHSMAFLGLNDEELSALFTLGKDLFTDARDKVTKNTALMETVYWQEVYDEYEEYMRTAEAELAGTYGIAIGDLEGLGLPYGEVTDSDDAWENVFLDDYQLELLKAKALEQYWAKQRDIAQAVYDYASDESSDRKTEAETEEDYENALEAYTLSYDIYRNSIAALTAKGQELSASRQAMDAARQELQEIETEIEQARSAYQAAFDLYITQNTGFFRQKISEYYDHVLELKGLTDNEETESKADLYAAYVKASRDFCAEGSVEAAVAELTRLITGDPADEIFPSLEELQESAENASGWDFDLDWTKADFISRLGTCFGLTDDPDDQGQPIDSYIAEFDAYADAKASGDTDLAWYRQTRLKKLTAQAASQAQASLDSRISAISLLHAGSLTDWAAGDGAEVPGDADYGACLALLENQSLSAESGYWISRANLEKEALSLLQAGLTDQGKEAIADIDASALETAATADGADDADVAAYSLYLALRQEKDNDTFQAESAPRSLEDIIAFISALDSFLILVNDPGNAAKPFVELKEDIRLLNGECPCLSDFISGGGAFLLDGIGFTGLLMNGEASSRRETEERYRTASRYAAVSPSLKRLSTAAALTDMVDSFREAGLIKPVDAGEPNAVSFYDPGSLLDREDLWGEMSESEVKAVLSDLSLALSQKASVLPGYAVEAAGAYLDRIASFGALHFSHSLSAQAADSELALAEARLADAGEWLAKAGEASRLLRENGSVLVKIFASYEILALGSSDAPGGGPQFVSDAARNLNADETQVSESLIRCTAYELTRAMLGVIEDPFAPLDPWDDGAVFSLDWGGGLDSLLSGLGLDTEVFGFKSAVVTEAQGLFSRSRLLYADLGAAPETWGQTFNAFDQSEKSLFSAALWNSVSPFVSADIYADLNDEDLPDLSFFTAARAFFSYDTGNFTDDAIPDADFASALTAFLDSLGGESGEVISAAGDIFALMEGLNRKERIETFAGLSGLGSFTGLMNAIPVQATRRDAYGRALYLLAARALSERAGFSDNDAETAGSFLCELAGIVRDTDGLRDSFSASAEPGGDLSLAQRFLILGGDDTAALYLLSPLAAAGAKPDELAAKLAVLGGVSPEVTSELERIRAGVNQRASYLPYFDGGVYRYATDLAGDGGMDDALYFASLLSGFPDAFGETVSWQGSTLRDSLFDCLAFAGAEAESRALLLAGLTGQLLTDELALGRNETRKLSDFRDWQKSKADYAAARESGDKNYRAYLAPALTGSAGKVTEVSFNTAEDDESLSVMATGSGLLTADWTGSETLETYNVLLSAQQDLLSAIDSVGETAEDGALLEGERNALAAYADLLGGAGILDSLDADRYANISVHIAYETAAATEDALKTSGRTLAQASSQEQYYIGEIQSLGKALESFTLNRNAMMETTIKPLAAEIEALEAVYQAAQDAWKSTAETFGTVNGEYAVSYASLKEAERESDDARFSLQKTEAIQEYASSGYLNLTTGEEAFAGEDNAILLSVNPDARLNQTSGKHTLALAAYNALKSLRLDGRPDDFINHEVNTAYKQAYDAYAAHFENTLKLKQVGALLNEALAAQQAKVDAAKKKVEKEITSIFSADILDEGNSNYRTETELDGWMRSMQSRLAAQETELFDDWGLAAWWELNQGNADEAIRALAEEADIAAGKVDIEYVASVKNQIKRGYNAAAGTALYDFYKTLNQTGMTMHDGFLTQQARYDVNDYLYDEFASKQSRFSEAQKQADEIAIGLLATAVSLSFFPPLAAPFYVAAAAVGLVANDYLTKAGYCSDGMNKAGANRDGSAGIMGSEKESIRAAVNNYVASRDQLNQEQAILSRMKCEKEGAATVGVQELIDAVIQASLTADGDLGAILGMSGASEAALRGALSGLFAGTGYETSLGDENKKSSSGMLLALADTAEQEKTRSEGDFQDEARTLMALRQQALASYTQTLNAVMAGELAPGDEDATTAVLTDAATVAFDSSLFDTFTHLTRLYDFSQTTAAGIDISLHPELARDEQALISMNGGTLSDLFSGRLTGFMEMKRYQWNQMLEDFSYKQELWENTMAAITAEGRSQWKKSLRRLETARNDWLEEFSREYEARSELWDLKYLSLMDSRNTWVEDAAVKTLKVGSEAVLSELGLSAETAIRASDSILIPDMAGTRTDPETVVAGILGDGSFAQLLSRGNLANRTISSINTALYSSLGADVALSGSYLAALTAYQGADKQAIEEHIALITADQARQAVYDAIAGFKEAVEDANVSVEKSVDDMLYGEGFTRESFAKNKNDFSREAMVDNTLAGSQYETQTIEGYEDYELPDFVLGVDLSMATLSKLSPLGVEAQIDAAMAKLTDFQKQIFGDDEKKEEGEFNEHVGTQAVMAEDASYEKSMEDNISDPGLGEMGRITGLLFHYLIKEGRGWTEFAKPEYDKRLWDDDGQFFKAPTIRGLADIGVAILANVLIPGSGLGATLATAALSLADDVVFTALDVDNGVMSSNDALLSLGKKAVTTLATSAINFGGGSIKTGTNFLGTLARTAIDTVTSFVSNGVGGFVNSWNFDENGKLAFDSEAFKESIIGKDALMGYATGAAASFTRGAMTGATEGLSQQLTTSIGSVAGFVSTGVKAGMEYALTGETSLNLLNFRDIGSIFGAKNSPSVGLMELTFNKETGASMSFGMGGMDMSLSQVIEVAKNIGNWGKQQGIRLFDVFGKKDFADDYEGVRSAGTALRSNWAYGDEKAQAQVDALLNGEDTLRVGYLSVGAQTTLEEGNRIVSIATLGTKDDLDSRLLAGVTLQHEAYRDGITGAMKEQFIETLNAVGSHTTMALRMAEEYGSSFILNNDNLRNDVSAFWSGLQSFANYVGQAYDYSEDNWLLTKEGKLQYDGRADLFSESGTVLMDVKAKGIEGGLLEILGIDPNDKQTVEALRQQLVSKGLSYGVAEGADKDNSDNWYWNLGANNELNMGKGIDASKKLLNEMTLTGRFNEQDLFNVLLSRGEIPDSQILSDSQNKAGYKLRSLINGTWADSWAEKQNKGVTMDYAEWREHWEKEYIKELLGKDLPIKENILPEDPLIRNDERIAEMRGVVVHWTENTWGDSAESIRNWFNNTSEKAGASSSHYGIGATGDVIRMVPEDYVAWASGGRQEDITDLNYTLFSGDPNKYTLSIEANPIYDRLSFDAEGNNVSPGFFSQNTYDSLVKLTTDILYRNDLESTNLLRHYDMTNKDCPRYMQPDIITNFAGVIYNQEWQDFKYRVQLMIEYMKN